MKAQDSKTKSIASTSRSIRTRATKSLLINPDDFADPLVVIPPDGGWGWLVVLASFIVMFCIDGVGYCFAVFFQDISRDLNCNVTDVALTSSMLGGFYYLAGPLTCSAMNRFGFRVIGVIGGVLAVIAFMSASYMKSILPFTILIGVCGGTAFNLLYTPSVIAIGFYFERWRALAMAIACCGSSLGVMCFPLIMTRFFGMFGWRTKFKILAAIFAFCGSLSLIYKPIKATKIDRAVQFGETSMLPSAIFTEDEEEITIAGGIAAFFRRFKNSLFPTISEVSIHSSHFSSHAPSRYSSKTSGMGNTYGWTFHRKCSVCCSKWFGTCCKKGTESSSLTNVNRPMYRDDIFYTGSVFLVSQYSRVGDRPASRSIVRRDEPSQYTLSVSRVATQRDLSERGQCVCCPEATLRVLATMLHFQMLTSPTFIVLLISGYLSLMGTYICYTYITERAIEIGIEKNSATMLLSILGISNTIGRAMCGVVSCFPTDINIVSWVAIGIAGSVTIASIFLTKVMEQIIFCSVFGFTLSAFAVLRTIVFVELFGIENLSNCFGLNMIFQSAAAFSGVPMANFLYTSTKSFQVPFVFAGSAILLSAILLIPIRCILRWEQGNRKKKATFDNS